MHCAFKAINKGQKHCVHMHTLYSQGNSTPVITKAHSSLCTVTCFLYSCLIAKLTQLFAGTMLKFKVHYFLFTPPELAFQKSTSCLQIASPSTTPTSHK
jgi:hypothetical protein